MTTTSVKLRENLKNGDQNFVNKLIDLETYKKSYSKYFSEKFMNEIIFNKAEIFCHLSFEIKNIQKKSECKSNENLSLKNSKKIENSDFETEKQEIEYLSARHTSSDVTKTESDQETELVSTEIISVENLEPNNLEKIKFFENKFEKKMSKPKFSLPRWDEEHSALDWLQSCLYLITLNTETFEDKTYVSMLIGAIKSDSIRLKIINELSLIKSDASVTLKDFETIFINSSHHLTCP